MGWRERPNGPGPASMPSTAAVAPRPSTLAPSSLQTGTSAAHAPRQRAAALWCRRWRMGSSFATRTKSPATSEGTGEHGVRASWVAAASYFRGAEGAEAEKVRARVASRREEQHTIVCSLSEIGYKLKVTFSLVDLSSRVYFPTPSSTAQQHDATFEIIKSEVTWCGPVA